MPTTTGARHSLDSFHGKNGPQPVEHLGQRLQVRAGPREGRNPPQHGARRPVGQVRRTPQLGQSLDSVERRVGSEERPVDRPNRGTQDDVRLDPAFGQSPEHADLVGTEDSASAKDECHLADRPIRRHA